MPKPPGLRRPEPTPIARLRNVVRAREQLRRSWFPCLAAILVVVLGVTVTTVGAEAAHRDTESTSTSTTTVLSVDPEIEPIMSDPVTLPTTADQAEPELPHEPGATPDDPSPTIGAPAVEMTAEPEPVAPTSGEVDPSESQDPPPDPAPGQGIDPDGAIDPDQGVGLDDGIDPDVPVANDEPADRSRSADTSPPTALGRTGASCDIGGDDDLILNADGLEIVVQVSADNCVHDENENGFAITDSIDASETVVVVIRRTTEGDPPDAADDRETQPVPYDVSFDSDEGPGGNLLVTANENPADVVTVPVSSSDDTIEVNLEASYDDRAEPTVGFAIAGESVGVEAPHTTAPATTVANQLALRFAVDEDMPPIALIAPRSQDANVRVTFGRPPRLADRFADDLPLRSSARAGAFGQPVDAPDVIGRVLIGGPPDDAPVLSVTTAPTLTRPGRVILIALALLGLTLLIIDRWDRINPERNPWPWLESR